MCNVVYIACAQPLREIAWDEAAPQFYVQRLEEDDHVVRQRFSHPHVYYVGSYQGCGCGLAYAPAAGDDSEEGHRSRRDRDLFAAFLEEELARTRASVQLFTCWAGDEWEAPDHDHQIEPDDIRTGRFGFEEGAFAVIGDGA
jgi:hypothetical protein